MWFNEDMLVRCCEYLAQFLLHLTFWKSAHKDQLRVHQVAKMGH